MCLVFTTALSVSSPWVVRLAIDDLGAGVTSQKLWVYALGVVGLVSVEGVFRYLMRIVLVGLSRDIELDLRNEVFRHLTLLEPAWYQERRIGDIMSRASNDMAAVRMVLGPGIMYAANTIATSAAAMALMFRISPLLSAFALLPLALVPVLVRHYGRQIHDRHEEAQEQLSTLTALVQENLTGARVVRAYVQEDAEMARFEAANREYLRRSRRLIFLTGALYPAIQFLMGLGAVTVLGLGGRLAASRSISMGDFVAFGVYLAMLHWPMIALGWVINLFERGEASMGRIHELVDQKPRIDDRDALPGDELRGQVSVRDLTFAHEGGNVVLERLSFDVAAGSTVAIVGPTGSGKSTLVSLLARLFDPPMGCVFVDGRDVRTIPLEELRGAIGFVPQETFLFSLSILENIALGLRGSAAEEGMRAHALWAAATAQLTKDVGDFPRGFDTLVGERGVTLSGGQRQRAALARALAIGPRILVLDDALASVDTETEERILEGLRRLFGSCTTFLVSHRVSTVRNADLILVLRDGRIAERGTHEALVALGGFYADLHRRQLIEQEVLTS